VPHLLLSPLLSLIPEQAQHQISCHPNTPIQRPTSPLQLDSCHVYNIYNINNSHNHQPNFEPHRYTSLESVSTPGCATTPTMSRLYNAYNTYNQLPNGQPNSQPNVSQPLPTHHPTGHPGILIQFFSLSSLMGSRSRIQLKSELSWSSRQIWRRLFLREYL
jgi:hypothetical protein